MNRRTFIQGASLVAVTPAFAAFLPLSHEAQSRVSQSMAAVQPVTGNGVDENTVIFKINGWDYANLNGTTSNEVSISINRSWRAAWR